MVKEALKDYLEEKISNEEISEWAYIKLAEEDCKPEDELVSEVLYNLVSFHDVGLIFAKYRPSREKLEYLQSWLDGGNSCNWEYYKKYFQEYKNSLN